MTPYQTRMQSLTNQSWFHTRQECSHWQTNHDSIPDKNAAIDKPIMIPYQTRMQSLTNQSWFHTRQECSHWQTNHKHVRKPDLAHSGCLWFKDIANLVLSIFQHHCYEYDSEFQMCRNSAAFKTKTNCLNCYHVSAVQTKSSELALYI